MSNLSNVRRYINDPDAVTYTDSHVLDKMNQAHVEQWVLAGPQITTATLTVTASTDIATLPTTIMVPQYFVYDNRQYWTATQADLERFSSKWREETVGQPKWFIRWSHNKVRVWPRPDATYALRVVGLGWPTEITAISSNVGIDNLYNRAVEHEACASLLEVHRPDLSDIHAAEARKLGYSYRVGLRNQQPHNIRRLHPATRSNMAQSGSISIGRLIK